MGAGVLCIGQIVADVVVRPVDGLPVAGRLNLVEDLALVPGGCACNTGCVLAKLGEDVRIAGLVGCDALGQAVLGEVAATGVDVSLISRTSEVATSSVIVVVASDGQRSFLYRTGTTEIFGDGMVPPNAFENCRIVHMGGAMKLSNLDLGAILKRARAAGCITSLDTDWDPSGRWLKAIGPALPFVDHLITNEEEGEALSGRTGAEAIAEALLALGPSNVVVKMGENGSLWAGAEGVLRLPAFPVAVVDTTCAGDAFVAGYLVGVRMGFASADRLALGNAAGGLATTALSHYGVQSLEATVEFIRAHREVCPDFELP